jgi:ElaB/YqjD/DUF883 family membrane-anchored ribosome-binding protein
MEATTNPTAGSTPATSSQVRSGPGNGARRLQDAATGEVRNLIADVEDLVSRVADVQDPDIVRIRNKVQAALVSTRDAVVSGAATVQRQVRQAAATTDDYVRSSPWQALGMAALAGAAIGYIAGRRR